jgi:hypothetical protein
MNALNEIVEYICDYEDTHNTFEFYKRIIGSIRECLSLLDKNTVSEEEQNMIRQADNIWNKQYDSVLLHDLHVKLGKKHAELIGGKKLSKDYYVKGSILFYLDSFEEWPDDERANALEYFVFNITNAGVDKDEIYAVIKKYFKDILYKKD